MISSRSSTSALQAPEVSRQYADLEVIGALHEVGKAGSAHPISPFAGLDPCLLLHGG